MDKKIVYFLCTGNSCRSQMAEGFGKEILGETWDVYSAGVEAHGLNPKAIQMMNEKGIDITNQSSSIIDKEILNRSDLVITLCGDAKDRCPTIPANVQTTHWDLPDPAKAVGTEEEILREFRNVRDEIETRIKSLAEN
ncbi:MULTISPECIES: arsenate reductase (thioredoxin) [Allobacillus]|uniref:Arsenate reductase n=1 Tax=Allobacillus salarius TaxID=1955272 RepID=A0A556PDI1_9BACI|nr:arsenate reductase (thioredoxin) [Allobacillus salarius]TSJ62447.1 arsenate reductase (thioredoxin) [Allobacillus salarius]